MSKFAEISAQATHSDRRGALSCAECRRSKLKCDRTIPCGSCVRRGCAELCPDKTLSATKGNKALVAHAQRLEGEVRSMKSKIRQLEEALVNAQVSTNPAQDASSSTLHTKSPRDFTSSISGQSGPNEVVNLVNDSLSAGLGPPSKPYGTLAGSEYMSHLISVEDLEESSSPQAINPSYLGLTPELVELSKASPYGIRDCNYPTTIFSPFMPSRETARQLTDLYYQNCSWVLDPIPRTEFESTIVSPIYSLEEGPSLETIHPHRLSVFFIVLALGATADDNADLVAEKYRALAAAALSLRSILKSVTMSSLQTLFIMAHYAYITNPATDESKYLLFGVCIRGAQLINLQRESGLKLDAKDLQIRRLVFWTMYTWDCWTSIHNSRACTFRVDEIQCDFPEDPGYVLPSGEVQLTFQGWVFRYSASCSSQSVRLCMAQTTPDYSVFLEMDGRIRTFPLPTHLASPLDDSGHGWSSDPYHAMQQYAAVFVRELNLLYLHRSYFAQAITDSPKHPLGHRYSPSVLAAYRSARRLISSLRSVYTVHSKIIGPRWPFWDGVFTSCYVIGGIVIETPGCSLAQGALQELERTIPFCNQVSRSCRTQATLAILDKLLSRARATYISYQNGVELTPAYLSDASEYSSHILHMIGRNGVNEGHASTSTACRRGPSACLNPGKPDNNSPLHVSDIGGSYDNIFLDPNAFMPEMNMGFSHPRQFMPRNSAPMADFSHTQQPRQSDQLYLREPQHVPRMNFGAQDQLWHQPRYHPSQDLRHSPNQVWGNFMQQLTTDGYHAAP